MYIARQLSFHGVNFKVEEVPLCEDFKEVYDASVKLVSTYSGIKIATSI
jgi:P-loop containing NTP hydrolase pore-1